MTSKFLAKYLAIVLRQWVVGIALPGYHRPWDVDHVLRFRRNYSKHYAQSLLLAVEAKMVASLRWLYLVVYLASPSISAVTKFPMRLWISCRNCGSD
jgi:hypothetical protein